MTDTRQNRKRQERKSISLSGPTYADLKEYALAHDISISSIVEKVIAPDLGHDPPTPRPARRYRGAKP